MRYIYVIILATLLTSCSTKLEQENVEKKLTILFNSKIRASDNVVIDKISLIQKSDNEAFATLVFHDPNDQRKKEKSYVEFLVVKTSDNSWILDNVVSSKVYMGWVKSNNCIEDLVLEKHKMQPLSNDDLIEYMATNPSKPNVSEMNTSKIQEVIYEVPFVGKRFYDTHPALSGSRTPRYFVEIKENGDVILGYDVPNIDGTDVHKELNVGKYNPIIECKSEEYATGRFLSITASKISVTDKKGEMTFSPECCGIDDPEPSMEGDTVLCPCDSEYW